MIYLITFVCYGRHLHGCESGSVGHEHNVPGTPILEVDSARAAAERERMDQAPYNLDQIRRDAVLEAIQEVCARRGWSLLEEPNRKRWARHGSTRWLWKPQHVSAAIQYVVGEQGDAMSAFESHEL